MRALRLDPECYDAYFELGRLQDGEHPDVVDRAAARAAYEAFLRGHETAGSPEHQVPLVDHALQRLGEMR